MLDSSGTASYDVGHVVALLQILKGAGAELQDALMLSQADVLAWHGKFRMKLPFRKLQKLIASLPANMWFQQLHAFELLPPECNSILDLYLYDVNEHWRRIHNDWALKTSQHGFLSFSYARLQPMLLLFEQQASNFARGIGQQQRLGSVWDRYGAVLEQGFGLHSAGVLGFSYAHTVLPRVFAPC